MNKEILFQKIKDYLDNNWDIDKEYTKSDIKNIYEAFVNVIYEEVENEAFKLDINNNKNTKINIPLIGRLNITKQSKYIARNPMTNEKVKVPACKKVYLSPYKKLKDAMNKK